jgi:hypothetical protein
MWTSRDILFRPFCGDLDDEAVLQPYIAQSIPNSNEVKRVKAPPLVRNPALYALGKIFIQLIENRPLVQEQSLTSNLRGDFSVDPEQALAAELEPTIERKAGKTWAKVIRRCLYCLFDVDTASARLDDDEFLYHVYAMVIDPLVEALQILERPL